MKYKEPVVRIELTANALRKHCSTAELHRLVKNLNCYIYEAATLPLSYTGLSLTSYKPTIEPQEVLQTPEIITRKGGCVKRFLSMVEQNRGRGRDAQRITFLLFQSIKRNLIAQAKNPDS